MPLSSPASRSKSPNKPPRRGRFWFDILIRMNKKKLFLWCLYDFANSFIFINFLLYFSQWLVIDGGLSDFWYNATFAIATVLLLFSAPLLAAFTDKYGGRKYFLNLSTFGTAFFYAAAVVVAYFWASHIILATIFFLLGQYFYQLCFVFYNPLIEEVADEKHRARASGLGEFSNGLGQVLGIVSTIGLSGSRLAPLVVAIILFIVFASPMMIWFRDPKVRTAKLTVSKLTVEGKLFVRKMILFFSVSLATPILLAFFFFNDALITISNNYSIYMQRVFDVPDATKSIILILVLSMSAIGAIIFGWIGDKIGNLKTLKIILFGWIILLPLLAISQTFIQFAICSVIVGMLIGSVWTVTRAHLSNVLDKDNFGYGFSFYSLMERFATFIGPLSWGGIILVLGNAPNSYRIAAASMTVFIVIGLIILLKWKREKLNSPH
ncbi:MAG: MFS transporter [Candidatus Kaiserbacteria bacterium]|nr:MFS transporter [Candidatus Kaiserbacteria bacterium]